MNTKGTKFLAVLAVMAMAFAAVAIVAPADDSDAAKADETWSQSGTITTYQPVTNKYATLSGDLTVKDGGELRVAAGVSFVVPAGMTLTITGDDGNDPASKSTLTVDPEALFVVEGTLIITDGAIFQIADTTTGGAALTPVTHEEGDKFHPAFVVNEVMEVNKGASATFGEVELTYNLDETSDFEGVSYFTNGAELKVTSIGTNISKVTGKVAIENGAKISLYGAGNEFEVTAFDNVLDFLDEKNMAKVFTYGSSVTITTTTIEDPPTTANQLGKLTITSTVNTYKAWTEKTPNPWELMKVSIYECNLNLSGSVKLGTEVTTNSDVCDKDFYTQSIPEEDKSDLDYKQLVTNMVIIPNDLVIDSGSFIVETGLLAVGSEATLSAKYVKLVEDVVEDPVATIASAGETTIYLYGAIKADVQSIEGLEGGIVIKGGFATFTDKGEITPPLALNYNGVKYVDPENDDAIVISTLAAALAAATLDSDITQVDVAGLVASGSVTDVKSALKYDYAYVIAEDYTISEDLTITFTNYVVIDEAAILTIKENGQVYGTSFTVDIKGEIMDFNCSVKSFTDNAVFNYEVIITDEDNTYERYMSFARAMTVVSAGEEIEISKNATVGKKVTIPADVKVILADDKKITITEDGKLINLGILDASEGTIDLEDAENLASFADYDGYFENNNIVMLKDLCDGTDFCGSGFYANGKIEAIDDKTAHNYFLAPEVASKYAFEFGEISAIGQIAYTGNLEFVADENGGDLTFTGTGTFYFGNLILDGFNFKTVENDLSLNNFNDGNYEAKGFSGIVSFVTSEGTTAIEFDEQFNVSTEIKEKDDAEGKTIETVKLTATGDLNDTAFLAGEVIVDAFNIAYGATVLIDDDAVLSLGGNVEVKEGTEDETVPVLNAYQFIIDGKLKVTADATIKNASILVNGTFEIPADEGNVKVTIGTAGQMAVLGSLIAAATEDNTSEIKFTGNCALYVGIDIVEYKKTIPTPEEDESNGVGLVSGKVTICDPAAVPGDEEDVNIPGMIVFAGADVRLADIYTDNDKEACMTEVYVNGILFATLYGSDAEVNPFLDLIYITGYNVEKVFYSDADMKKIIKEDDDKATIKNLGAVYAKANSKTVLVKYGIGSYVDLFINDVAIPSTGFDDLKIGTYTVTAKTYPGFVGTLTIYMDGVKLTDNTFVITPEMAEDGSDITISVSGDVAPIEPEKKDLEITEILLIVLVVLIVILAVVVILRLNRS